MTSLDGPSGNIALLIDADNASAAHFDPVMTVLAELGTVNIRRAYGNWSKATLKSWAALSIAQAIEPQQQFDLTKGKNATDMKMTIDAMDLMASGRVSGFGLMSSDSDFTPLVTRIRQQGIPVYGFGRMSSPEGFRRACTRFIDVMALAEVDADDAVVEKTTPPARARKADEKKAQPAKAAPPAPTPVPAQPSAPSIKKAVDAEVIKLLIDAESQGKVMSDDDIAAVLRDEGIDLARRTVAKYREALGIPSSIQRRREMNARRLAS